MGQVASLLDQCFPPKPNYTVEQIPDLKGQVMIVTGASGGIGEETAKALLAHGAKVYIATRNEDKAKKAIQALHAETGQEASFLELDLANLSSIKAATQEFLSKENQLHVLFNNGGVMASPMEQLTPNGYDLQFGTNLLLPTMIATAAQTGVKTRVVNTSSIVHYYGNLDFNTFKDGPARRKLSPPVLYGQSKYGNVVFSTELARRYGNQGIVSTAVNPGNLKTDLARHRTPLHNKIMSWLIYDRSYGALTQLWAGTSPEAVEFNGKFLKPWARIGEARPDSQDPSLGKQLWEWCEEQVAGVI